MDQPLTCEVMECFTMDDSPSQQQKHRVLHGSYGRFPDCFTLDDSATPTGVYFEGRFLKFCDSTTLKFPKNFRTHLGRGLIQTSVCVLPRITAITLFLSKYIISCKMNLTLDLIE